MTLEETAAKFRSCAEFAGWPGDKSAKVVELVSGLERIPDMGKLTAVLAG